MDTNAILHSIIIDCKEPAQLSAFYAQLLGWRPVADSWNGIISPQGAQIEFQQANMYEPPVWPAIAGQQGQMMHLDFYVDDLEQTVTLAQQLGAAVAPRQFYAAYQCITLFDPEGHPFCLLQKPAV